MKHPKSLIAIVAVTALISATSGLSAQTTAPKMTAANSNNLTFDTTPDDHARLKEIFKNDHSAQKIDHAKFSLAPGAVVPGSIRLSPLPQTISNIQPTWQGNQYFRVGRNKVVIVDPQSKTIEGVLTL